MIEGGAVLYNKCIYYIILLANNPPKADFDDAKMTKIIYKIFNQTPHFFWYHDITQISMKPT